MDKYSENLQDILKRAQNLSVELESSSNIPKINRNIFQVLEEGQSFFKKNKPVPNEADLFKASLLLGEKGYSVPDANFESFQDAPTEYEVGIDTDIESFIKNDKENDLINLLLNSKQQSEQICDEYCEKVMQNDWENNRRKLFMELGSFSPSMTGPLQKPALNSKQVTQKFHLKQQDKSNTTPLNSTLLNSSLGYNGVPSALDALEAAQAAQLILYNSKMLHSFQNTVGSNANCHLFKAFAECAQMYGDADVREMWSLVCNVITEPNTMEKSARSFRASTHFQHQHIGATKRYLEEIYLEFIRAQLEPMGGAAAFLFDAGSNQSKMAPDLGPSYQLIHRHCQSMCARGAIDYQAEGGTMDQIPVWMMIYNLARTGLYSEALGYGRSIRHILGDAIFEALEIAASSAASVQNGEESSDLNPDLEQALEVDYRKFVKFSSDPYKKACYCILGKLNFEETFSQIITKTDDYLWFKLCIVKPDTLLQSSPVKSERVLLFSELQNSLLKQYGPDYFRADEKPWLFFKILICVAEFESAIQFLASNMAQSPKQTGLLGQAVCLAIALYQANMLQITTRVEDDLITENKASLGPSYNLNLCRSVSLYVKRFETVDIEEALNYYYVLRDIKCSSDMVKDMDDFDTLPQLDMYTSNAARLIVETKNFEAIVGTLSPKEGIKLKDGIIDKLGTDVKLIINTAATEFENIPLYPQAIHLYQISKEYSRLFALLRTLLAELLANPSTLLSTSSIPAGLISLADTIAQRYTEGNSSAKNSSAAQAFPMEAGNFFVLLDLCKFFQSYLSENYDDALYIVEQLRLVPFEKSTVDFCVSNFSSLCNEVRNLMPEILVAVMTMLARKYKEQRAKNSLTSWSGHNATFNGSGFIMDKTIPFPDQSYASERQKVLQEIKAKADLLIKYPAVLPYRFTGDTNSKLVQLAQSML